MDIGYPKEKYSIHGGSCTVLSKEQEKRFPYPDWQDQPVMREEVPVKKQRGKRIEEPIEAN